MLKPFEPHTAYIEALNQRKPVPELEEVIATDSWYSYLYARDVIKGPWKLGEPAIIKRTAILYAIDIIKGRWVPGESAIAADYQDSYLYARDVIKGPWKLGEAAIATNAEMAYVYAKDIIKGRWEPGEAAISDDPDYCKAYIQMVLRSDKKYEKYKSDPEFMKYILTNG